MKALRIFLLIALVFVGGLVANQHFHLYDRLVHPETFYFVTANGRDFFLEGEPLRFIGANTRLVHGQKERAVVDEVFDAMARSDLRVVRQWAIGESESDSAAIHHPIDQYYFQAGPNNWQEASFRHFDSLLVAAAARDLKVIVTLFNNWKDYGGIPMYLHWAGVQESPLDYAHRDSFYVHPQVGQWAKAMAEKWVTRVNSISGVAYRDDPTIFAWEIFNESTAAFDRVDEMNAWIVALAAHIKALDANHFVGSSFSLYDRRLVREHMIEAFESSTLDYCDVHLYPQAEHQRYLFAGEMALEQVVDDLAHIAQAVGKPLLIGEVGFSRYKNWREQGREYWYRRLFDHGLAAGVAGVLVWSYSDPDWEDEFEINWREQEHEAMGALLAEYGRRYAEVITPIATAERAWDGTLQVEIPVQEYAREDILPQVSGDLSSYHIPVQDYIRAQWINFGYWRPERGFASVYAKDHGFFEYAFSADSAAVLGVKLTVRLSTDFPPLAAADSLGRSEVRVLLNGAELGTVLVRPRRFFGTVHQLAVERGADAPFCYLLPGKNVLRFEVPEDAVHQNGIAILGEAVEAQFEEVAMPILLQLRLGGVDQVEDHRAGVDATGAEN